MERNVARNDVLETLFLDVDDIIADLEIEWQNHPDYNINPTAFSKIKSSGDNYMFCCPYHHENDPDSGLLKEYPYLFNCFACGTTASLPQLVAYGLNLSTEVHGEIYILKNYAVLKANERPKIDLDLILDGGKKLDKLVSHLDIELEQYKNNRHPYLYSRGFTERTLQKYEVGYDEKSMAMVIPVRTSKGQIRFFKKRFINRKGFLNETNIFKKDIVFGLFYLIQALSVVPKIFLTESETDTIACYQGKLPSGAILGRILFQEQVQELLKAGVREVNLFYDNDKYGMKCALQSYELLKKYPIRINIVLYPGLKFGIDTFNEDEIIFKDANNLLKANLLNQIEIVEFNEAKINWSKIVEM